MNNRMDPERKSEWVAALRSGEYPQGSGRLKMDGKYCCLGVLCDLAVKAGIIQFTPETVESFHDDPDHLNPVTITHFDSEVALLPKIVQEWVGLDSNNPFIKNPRSVHYGAALAELNDSGKSFQRIADIIEENF